MHVLIDVHEPDEIKQQLQGEVTALPAGDYMLFGEKVNVVVERKEIDDFVGSIRSERFWGQLQGIKYLMENENFRGLVLIEGEQWRAFKFRKLTLPQWFGMLQAITIGYGIPVAFTKNTNQTVVFLKTLGNRIEAKREYVRGVAVKKEGRDVLEQAEDMLCMIDGFGRKKARDILKHYSIKEIVINPGLLHNIHGIGQKLYDNFVNVINARR